MENELNIMPRLGEPAPAFKANTTQGPVNFPDDFQGKWVILFSHPADFTPVCTSEFMTFGKMAEDFKALNCQLLGLSVDGLSSHIAWLRRIKEIEFNGMKNIDVRFPLIDDISMNVAKKYGMIQPGESQTAAVRAVFFIDPKGMTRTILYYPLSLGRNFEEIKRILIGLQTVDNFNVALPADWQPGSDVIVPASRTMDEADERMADNSGTMTCHDWFFCTKKITKEEVESKLGK
ncbi:peroxiredoxin [Bacteroidales bacterium OttesenSCG-928-B11]|nr:peroxiredoxin [Bacteroidales bacterium OttesenSCG-928-E04]MDL2312407.1 peroxiredoxin [Bacteroidales bacterium OttesenSCG-928-B11]MDL2326310.1 peroxiredoxin [Bacteroidales bacterium OttesenSCG-928-A14]